MRLQSEQNGQPLPLTNGPSKIVKDRRFELDYDADSGSYKLTIDNVVKEDEGKYQCQVVSDVSHIITSDVLLSVRIEPTMVEDSDPYVMAEAGKSAELFCEASGYPSPKITWKKQDGTLLPSGKETETNPNGKLVIQDVKREQRGNYICTADNGVGKSKERVIQFQVGFPPSIEMETPKAPQALGYEANLMCTIQAHPSPTIQWVKNGENIHNGYNFKISHFASEDDYITSSLKIYYVYEEDYGEYSCKAGNRYGSKNATMELYESTVPIPVPVAEAAARSNHFNIVLFFIPIFFRIL